MLSVSLTSGGIHLSSTMTLVFKSDGPATRLVVKQLVLLNLRFFMQFGPRACLENLVLLIWLCFISSDNIRLFHRQTYFVSSLLDPVLIH